MKVAFCYSGMFRDFTKNIDNHICNLISDYDSDIYLSFWDIQGYGNFKNPVDSKKSSMVSDKEKLEVIKKLKPKFVEYEKFSQMEEYFINYEIQKNIVRDFPPYIRNIMSMYYKLEKCGKEVEKSLIEYDVIVRLRSDLWFNEKVNLSYFEPGVLNCNVGDGWNLAFDDKFFYGDSFVMNSVKNIYSELDNIWENTNYYNAPEHLLYLFLNINKIKSKPITINYKIKDN